MVQQICVIYDAIFAFNLKLHNFFKPLTDVIYGPNEALSKAFNRSEDQITYVLCMLASFIFCMVLAQIKHVPTRKVFSSLSGLLMTAFMHGIGIFMIFGFNMIGYVSLSLFDRKTQKYVTLIFGTIGLLLATTYKQYMDYPGFDVGLIIMVNYVKLTVLAINYHDADKTPNEMSAREQKYTIKEKPSFVDYFGFFFFCGSAVTGPPFEFNEHLDFINLRGDYAFLKRGATIIPGLKRLAATVLYIGLTTYLDPYVQEEYMLTDEFANDPRGLPYKMIYMSLLCKKAMWTYFSGFTLMDGGLIFSGQGYRPATDKEPETYNRFPTINLW